MQDRCYQTLSGVRPSKQDDEEDYEYDDDDYDDVDDIDDEDDGDDDDGESDPSFAISVPCRRFVEGISSKST